MTMPLHIQKIYDNQVSIIAHEYSLKCRILKNAYDKNNDKSSYIIGRDNAYSKFKVEYVKILLSLSWEDQIQFCHYAHFSEELTQYLDDDQMIAYRLLQ